MHCHTTEHTLHMGQPLSKVLPVKHTPKTVLQLIADHAGQEREETLIIPQAKWTMAGSLDGTVHDMQAVRIQRLSHLSLLLWQSLAVQMILCQKSPVLAAGSPGIDLLCAQNRQRM